MGEEPLYTNAQQGRDIGGFCVGGGAVGARDTLRDTQCVGGRG